MVRDHGGNLDSACRKWGGKPNEWIDLSTGINRRPYPLPDIPRFAWTALPDRRLLTGLTTAARRAYGTEAPILALAGASAPIQLLPRLLQPGRARVLGPTYNEHSASLAAAGWQVMEVTEISGLSGADLAVVVNPNNPDGRAIERARLEALADTVGHLLVDESFVDPTPGLSLMPVLHHLGNVTVLRSFGKFFGLAGLRLGFAAGQPATIEHLSDAAGPWPVSGPAATIGTKALADADWAKATTARLAIEAPRLDRLAAGLGWKLAGGTMLFRLYSVPGANAAQARLARGRIWSRTFPWSSRLLRLGLPGDETEWARLATAMQPS